MRAKIEQQALTWLQSYYGLTGELKNLPGELDCNYRLRTSTQTYVLKISLPNVDEKEIYFQYEILDFLNRQKTDILIPAFIKSKQGQGIVEHQLSPSEKVYIRLITWVEGHVMAELDAYSVDLLWSLGAYAGKITKALQSFESDFSKRTFDWDINNCFWTQAHQNLFEGAEKEMIQYFYQRFEEIWPKLKACRHSVIHNDANDYNVLVDLEDASRVKAIIDYGDAVYTSTINDLAVCLTYVMMNKQRPLEAALPIVRAYHQSFPLTEQEVSLLYVLVGARLVISLTKSKINRLENPDNTYLTISEKPGWDLIKKWRKLDAQVASDTFFNAIKN